MDADPFQHHPRRYDQWYARHPGAYRSELAALRALLPPFRRGLEIGVGSGRFAAPLGVDYGIDPALPMLRLARERGIRVAAARAEALPFPDHRFDLLLVVTTLCFIGDRDAFLAEAARVLHPRGRLLLGLIDWGAPTARPYLAKRRDDPYYRHARPTPAAEIDAWLTSHGWRERSWRQTLIHDPDPSHPEPVHPGHGQGLFAAVRAAPP